MLDLLNAIQAMPAGNDLERAGIAMGGIVALAESQGIRRTLWSPPLDSTRVARPRVVTTLSIRLGPLIALQMPRGDFGGLLVREPRIAVEVGVWGPRRRSPAGAGTARHTSA